MSEPDVRAARWQAARRVLCVRLDNMGDVLMCTPAMRALRATGAGRHITLLASRSGVALAPHLPEIDQVMAWEAPWIKATSLPDPAADLAFIERLREQRFDAAVIFTTYSQSALPAALACMLAGIPLRLAHCRENPYHLLSDWLPETEPQQGTRHEVRRQLDLVATIGATVDDEHLSFAVLEEDRASLQEKLEARGIDAAIPWLVVHAGATAASRRYPLGHFVSALQAIRERLDCHILLTGSASEAGLCDALRNAGDGNTHSLAGALSLGELAALIEDSALLLSNNSGPVHIAAAVGTPVVDLYALTNPQHTPWQVEHRVLFHDVPCRNCYKSVCPQGHHACLEQVDPREVAATVCDMWPLATARHAPRRTPRALAAPPDTTSAPPFFAALS